MFHFRRVYFFLFFLMSLFSLIFVSGKLIYKEFRSGYTNPFQSTYSIYSEHGNLLKNWSLEHLERFFGPFRERKEVGLPIEKIYIPEKSITHLMEKVPDSIKNWKKAYVLNNKGSLEKVKVRARGDNPLNWANEKKSWRLKRKKRLLKERVRIVNYIVPQEAQLISYHLGLKLAKTIGLLSADTSLVELFINDKNYGLYTKAEHFDENFLRNNGRMPVNFYKGEQYNSERKMMLNPNLFNNPWLWRKVSTFNQLKKEDFSDLESFFDLVRKAESGKKDFTLLKETARFEDWALFSAYQTLAQNWSGDNHHNNRVVIDPWKGNVIPVPIDSALNASFKDPIIDYGTNSILKIYNQSSEFLFTKHKILLDLLRKDVIGKFIKSESKELSKVKNTWSRDHHKQQFLFSNYIDSRSFEEKELEKEWEDYFKKINFTKKEIQKKLEMSPVASWYSKRKKLSLVVGGVQPVKDIEILLKDNMRSLKVVYWDKDGDGVISKEDLKIPFDVVGKRVIIRGLFYANRIIESFYPKSLKNGNNLANGSFEIVPTQFNLIFDQHISVKEVLARNGLTGIRTSIVNNSKNGVSPSLFNEPLFSKDASSIWMTLPLSLKVQETTIFDRPVKILPGTIIEMAPGVSLLFKNKLIVGGNKELPVLVKELEKGKPWGTFAIHGNKTKGSKFSHLHIKGGSGALIKNVRYTSMLSIHEVQGLEMDNLKLSHNHIYDDMVHIIYSKNIKIRDSEFFNSFLDTIDIDISKANIKNVKIYNSGNDGIDLMSSDIIVENSEIKNSKDKGISVGEGSLSKVVKTILRNNGIGIESKDGSIATINDSQFIGNKVQLNAYLKNWRYSNGGNIIVRKSLFESGNNIISSDHWSKIKVINSKIDQNKIKKSKNVKILTNILGTLSFVGDKTMKPSEFF
ncbi:CotH kinase family protein [Bacteriovoracales bacterium]|nr:CotH kinase family protein [Bacteriovoracales bacterium]